MKDIHYRYKWPIDAHQPKIICLCGSVRFREDFEYIAFLKTIEIGAIILMPHCWEHEHFHSDGQGKITKEFLDELHKRKIDLADEVLVINKDGYIGESTQSEIDYAYKVGTMVKYMEPPIQRTLE